MLSLPRLPASVPLKPVQTLGPSASAFLSAVFVFGFTRVSTVGGYPLCWPFHWLLMLVLGHVASSLLPGAITTTAVAMTRDHVWQAPSGPAGH